MTKIGVIGGGSIFSPELISLFSNEIPVLGPVEVTFMDIDKKKMDIVGSLCKRIVDKSKSSISIRYVDSYEEAIAGKDFILIQFRVGGEEARIEDELLGKKYKIPFVETVTVCGIATFLRTYREIVKIAQLINQINPDAWVLNFANPAGIVAESFYKLGVRNIIGVCNASTRLFQFLKQKIPYSDSDNIFMTWRGLNHLTAVDSILLNGREILPAVLESLEDFESDRTPFEKDLVRSLGFLPNQYFQYYFRRSQMVEKLLSQDKVRSEVVREVNAALIEQYKNIDYVPEGLTKRGGSGYSKTVVDVIKSLLTGDDKIHYIVTKNMGSIPELSYDAFVECPASVGKGAVRPLSCGRLPKVAASVIVPMKIHEDLLIQSALESSKGLLYQSMMAHPLLGEHGLTVNLLEDIIKKNKEYLPNNY